MITRAQADTFFAALLGLGLLTGLAAGLLARRGGKNALLPTLLWGGPLVLIGVMWRVYNAITDRIGLDRVANLVVNLGLFLVLGTVCGLGWTALAARSQK